MSDVHDKLTRSYNMSQIGGKNTEPEIIVRKFLFSKGYRFRLHVKSLPGKPDIVLTKYKIIIHVHGCFWHCHDNCSEFVVPKSNQRSWINKLYRNIERDNENDTKLKALGWKIFIIWECTLKSKLRNNTLNKLIQNIRNAKTN